MSRSGTGERITDRQVEVARLVYLGRTNGEIASELGISLDGAKYHVSELLGRLGVERREEIGAWYAAEHGSWLRERIRWVLSPVGAVAAGAAGVAVLGVVVVAIAIVRADPSPATDDPASVGGLRIVPVGGMHDPARISHDATRLLDGRVLVTGGVDPDLEGGQSMPLRSAEIYDPRTDTWTRVEDMPFALLDHVGVTLPDGRVLFMGGISPGPGFQEAMETQLWFDPASETFVTRPSDPALDGPLAFPMGPTTVLRRAGEPLILIEGGRDAVIVTYDPESMRWLDGDPLRSEPSSVPSDSRSLREAYALSDGRVLTRWLQVGVASDSFEEIYALYDPADGSLAEVYAQTPPPFFPAVVPVDNAGFLLLGGSSEFPGTVVPADTPPPPSSTPPPPVPPAPPLGAGESRSLQQALYVTYSTGEAVPVEYVPSTDGLRDLVVLPDGRAVLVAAVTDRGAFVLPEIPPLELLQLMPVTGAGQVVTTLDDGRLLVTGGLRLTSDARTSIAAGELELPSGPLFSFAPDDAASLEPFEESPALLITLP